MRSLTIRQAAERDYPHIFALLDQAFQDDPNSDHNEAEIVQRLSESEDFIAELSLAAVHNDQIIGYILLTPVRIHDQSKVHQVLALAPVAVLPSFQRKGVGAALIEKGHEMAKSLGYTFIVLIGHDSYYPRFGYKQAKTFEVSVPFHIPSKYIMARELVEGAGKYISGRVRYPPPFHL